MSQLAHRARLVLVASLLIAFAGACGSEPDAPDEREADAASDAAPDTDDGSSAVDAHSDSEPIDGHDGALDGAEDADAQDVPTQDVVDEEPSTDWGACTSQCLLLEPGCCESCRELTLDDVVPVARELRRDFQDATCDEDVPVCSGCVSTIDANFVALCTSGRCEAHDVRASTLSACESDGDCIPRYPDCCNCSGDLIALAEDQVPRYLDAICTRRDCPSCDGPPPGTSVSCIDGHCAIVR